jgi:ketosteroid isomerase-like protein
MRDRNEAVAERLIAAIFAGDKDAMRACIAPEFVMRQGHGQPYGGVYTGPDGFLTGMEKVLSTYEFENRTTIRTYWADDADHMFYEFEADATIRKTGRKYHVSVIEHWAFKNGKVAGITPYWLEIPG